MKEKLVSKEMVRSMHPIFKGKFGGGIVNLLFPLLGVDELNLIYDQSKHLTGCEFASDVLNKMRITRALENQTVLEQFAGKPFITVSNHPYGHIDGVIMASVLGELRSDYKMMVNWLLTQIDTMEDLFIGVNPFPKGNKLSQAASSVSGLKQCMEHLQEGHPLGLFPAGGVSRPDLRGKVMDRAWQSSSIRLIKNAEVPVIPVYISGSNSFFYQLLGHIGWKTRSVWLLRELRNKRGKTISIRFGTPVLPEEIASFSSLKDLERHLYTQTYSLREKND